MSAKDATMIAENATMSAKDAILGGKDATMSAEDASISASFKIPTHPEVSGSIRKYPEVSRIGTSSAEICMRPISPLLAHAAPPGLSRPLSPATRSGESAASARPRAERSC